MLHVFTSLKPSVGRIATIQTRTLANWRERFGVEARTFEGEPPEFGRIVEEAGNEGVVLYANADVLFGEEVARVVDWCAAQTEDFLVVGRRVDELQGGQREVHRPSGMDYFFFRAGMFRDLPRTIVGRAYYDCALLAYCMRRGVRVVDASEVLEVVHQGHDYGHVAGGRAEVFGGEAALANKRNNLLRDYGPHISDVRLKFEPCRSVENVELRVVRKWVPMLRRLGLWGLWNRVTRGGLGFWGFHVYAGRGGARLVTRSQVELWPVNSNLRQKFALLGELPRGVYSGFDFPSMWKAWRLAKAGRMRWTMFLWDPPALSHRDGCAVVRWGVDAAWRWFARRADRIVLNIHPGLLGEMGYRAREGQVVCFTNGVESEIVASSELLVASREVARRVRGRIGVVAQNLEQAREKGVRFVEEALRGEDVDWITGVSREEALRRLGACEIMLLPYPPSHARKWNYPLKLFEYMALGGKIVACDNPGVASIVRDGVNGFLYRSGDAASLRDAIARARQATEGRVEARAREDARQYVWEDIHRKMIKWLVASD